MNNTKQKIYSLMQNLFLDKNYYFSEEDFLNDNHDDMKELVFLITNLNPFVEMDFSYIEYEREMDDDAWASYDMFTNTIKYSTSLIEKITKKPKTIGMLFDSAYHEKRHRQQYLLSEDKAEIVNGVNVKEIYLDMIDDEHLSKDEIQELNRFAASHNLIHLKLPKFKLRTLHFGAYCANKAEVDARNYAHEKTIETFKAMISDSECPDKLKPFLEKSLNKYIQEHNQEVKENESSMKDYAKLEERIKNKLFKIVKSDSRVDPLTFNQLCCGVMSHISRSVSLEENLEIVGWAIKNNYEQLLWQIDLGRALKTQTKDVEKFLLKLTKKNMVSYKNMEPLASMLMPMEGAVFGENLIERLINMQVENGKPFVLIKSMANKTTFGLINSERIYDALMIYLNKIAITGIVDVMQWKEFIDIKHWLNILIGKTTQEKDKEVFLLLKERVLKVEEIMKNPYLNDFDEENKTIF